ncbi:unnamed protein product, partial [Allacma fusca]
TYRNKGNTSTKNITQIQDDLISVQNEDQLLSPYNLSSVPNEEYLLDGSTTLTCTDFNAESEALRNQIASQPPDHQDTLVKKHQVRYNEAHKLYNEVLQIQIKLLGPGHSDSLRTK